MAGSDDLDVISRVLLGERQAFAELVQKYQQRIRGFCRCMLGSEAAGEDAAQEVFIRAFQKLKAYRADAPFDRWLLSIARNHCLDLLRRQKHRKEDSLEALQEELGDRAAGLVSNARGGSPEDIDAAQKVLKTLPEHYREVVILREFYGMSYEEMARTLDCSVDAIKARLKKARAAIGKTLTTLFACDERHRG